MTCETHSDHTWTDVVIDFQDFRIFKIISNPQLKSTFEHSKTKTEQHKTLWNFKQTLKNPQNKTEWSFRKFKNFWWESNSKLFQNANSENEVIQTKIREFSKRWDFEGFLRFYQSFLDATTFNIVNKTKYVILDLLLAGRDIWYESTDRCFQCP